MEGGREEACVLGVQPNMSCQMSASMPDHKPLNDAYPSCFNIISKSKEEDSNVGW